jgi:hypothetical protein
MPMPVVIALSLCINPSPTHAHLYLNDSTVYNAAFLTPFALEFVTLLFRMLFCPERPLFVRLFLST